MIILPSNVGPNGAEPYFVDAGGWQVPAVGGGDATRIDHLGSRYGLSVSMPPMRIEDEQRGIHARVWVSRLNRGVEQGVRLKFPQPGFAPGTEAVGQVAVAQVAQATLLQISGVGADAFLKEGMFITLVRAANGRRFLHSVNADVVANAGGTATIGLHPRLRYAPQVGDVVLLHEPEIEGRLLGGRQKWTIDLARLVGIQFEIEEIA